MSARDPQNELDAAWVWQAKAVLDQSVEGLDAATASRLNQARHAALARRPARQHWFLPAGLASACVLMLAVFTWHAWRPMTSDDAIFPKAATSGDIELVSSDDSLEFYQDLEFYAWLDAQDQDLGS